jgi:hypothetical protein
VTSVRTPSKNAREITARIIRKTPKFRGWPDVRRQKSSRSPLNTGCRALPSADLALYSISAMSAGSTQMPRCAILFA